MSLAALLILAVLPQHHPAPLKLPPRAQGTAEKEQEVRPVSEIERFRRDVQALKSAPTRFEDGLRQLGETYRAIDTLVIEVARAARANEMSNLMPVALRYGAVQGSRIADELLFQLLARPLGEATREVVMTLAALRGGDAKPALKELLRGRISAVRRYAVEAMTPLLSPADVDFALSLARDQSMDLQLRGIELLRALADERSLQRLIELLAKDPAIAAVACAALVQVGPPAVAPLQRLCAEPAIDRAFGYAAFALAQIGLAIAGNADIAAPAGSGPILPPALLEPLVKLLRDIDPLTRQLAAIPLADLAFFVESVAAAEAEIVAVLIDTVQPLRFVANIDLLRLPAQERLLRMTGRVLTAADALPWREWWTGQKDTFMGLRAKIAVTEADAEHAIVSFRQEQRHVRLLASGLAELPPVAGALEIVLTPQQMLELVRAMEAQGFGDRERLRVQSALPDAKSLQIQVRRGRSQIALPLVDHPVFDGLVALVQQRVDAELWQLYRNEHDEPDRAAFWRAERRWLDANPEPIERGRRFARRVVNYWPQLTPSLRARAIEHLLGRADRRELLREDDGDRILTALAAVPSLGELDLRLLELAAAVPGDQVWRRCVELAVRAQGGGRKAVRAVFAVLGPDAVLSALDDTNPLVRRAAVEEVVVVNDVRAAPRLVELLADPDLDVRRNAALAAGQMQLGAAAKPLVQLIAAEDTPPLLRRECLRALGRVGGEMAFPVLQRAMASPSNDDKEAAMRGLGDLRDARAAFLLAELVVVAHGKDLGTLAQLHLQRQGGTRAVPALRAQLETTQDAAIREQLVMLLGYYQDPAVVPDLMDLLHQPRRAAEATDLLGGTTGVDLVTVPDRVATIEMWWRKHKLSPQWQWLLDALRAADVPTTLRPEHFAAGADLSPVAELARLVVETAEPRLWVLSAAVLRAVTREDFGVVTYQTTPEVREGIAARYRLMVETSRAAQGR